MLVRPFDRDPLTGLMREFVYDDARPDEFRIHTAVDVEPLLEDNKRAHNDATDAHWRGDMHRVASIPMAVYADLKRRGIADDPAALRKWLNDPDNALFRTRPGTV